MMKSESDNALTAHVPPYLRAYGSTYGSTSGRQQRYQSGSERAGWSHNETQKRDMERSWVSPRRWGSSLWRFGSVLVVLILLSIAVSSAHSRWTTGSWQAEPQQHMRSMKEGVNGMFIETAHPVPQSLVLGARNEYGEFDHRALALYGLDMVVEPYRETHLQVIRSPTPQSTFHPSTKFHWLLVQADDNGDPLEGVEPVVDAKGGVIATVELTIPAAKYALVVQQLGTDGSVVAEGRITIACKYVRRELRSLTDRDRTDFFEAMQVFYTITVEEGEAKYGKAFSNYARLAAYHNSRAFCYHNGIQFLTAHTAFNLVVERSLQIINPRVSLASWDFMVEAEVLGTAWPTSEIFGPDMFGSAFGKADNSFQISDGWFANISSIYDPKGDMVSPWVQPNRNAYGYTTATHNFQDLPGITRTHSYCGLHGEAWFAKSDVFVGCFDAGDSLYAWEKCMEIKVHASMHGMIGGGFNCNMNMQQFYEEHPEYSRPLLTFALEYITAKKWPSNTLMHEHNTCDEVCELGQECGCTCLIDPFSMDDDEVYGLMEYTLSEMSVRFAGDSFIYEDPDATYPFGFMQAGQPLSHESTFLLLRVLLMIGCEPGAIGAMAGGASPSDPIFWVLHPIYEKGLHILELSPSYRDRYDFSWVNGTCDGSSLHDEQPFTEQVLGFGSAEHFLTNAELFELFNPANGRLSYMYDSFQQWGTCNDWDPCPECVRHASAGDDVLPRSIPV